MGLRRAVIRLNDHTWPEAEAARPWLLVPLGSCEQHGPHLPLDTDTTIALAVAAGVAIRRADVVVAPALPYGASGEHAAFPGTLSIGLDALERLVVELVRSADHFAGTVLVNGHGGNAVAVDAAVARLRSEGRDARAWWPRLDGDAHAGRTETSLMLALAPERVRLDRAEPGCRAPLRSVLAAIEQDGVRAISANGVLGDPTEASAAEGRSLLAALVDDLAASVPAISG